MTPRAQHHCTSTGVQPISPSTVPSEPQSNVTSATPKLLLTVPEAAAALRMSRAALYKLLQCGEIPSLKIGRMRRISTKTLSEWIETQLAA